VLLHEKQPLEFEALATVGEGRGPLAREIRALLEALSKRGDLDAGGTRSHREPVGGRDETRDSVGVVVLQPRGDPQRIAVPDEETLHPVTSRNLKSSKGFEPICERRTRRLRRLERLVTPQQVDEIN
jgi:hypothetical protein